MSPSLRRPALLLAGAVAAAALAALLPAAPDVAHAQSVPPSLSASNYIAGDGDGEFSAPEGIAMHLIDGTIFVADTGNHRIQVFHPNGTFAFKIGGPDPGSGPGEFTAPVGIGLGKNREILVADTGNHRVQVFHPNGTFDFQFGSFGTADGEFSRPEGVMYDYQLREFVVADTGNHRIQTFHLNGTFAFKFGTYGTDAVPAAAPIVCTHPLDCLPPSAVGTVRFNEPTSALRTGIAPYPAAFSVADTGNNRIQSFSLDKLGGVDMPHHLARDQVTTVLNGTGGVEFDGIRSLATGAPLSVVADTGNHRVPRFGTYGVDRFDFSLGSYGSGPGEFSSPMGAAGSYRGYAVADTGNDRVQVFHRNTTLNFVLGLVGNATGNGGAPTDGGGGGAGNGGAPTDGGGAGNGGTPGGTPSPSSVVNYTAGDGDGEFSAPEGIAMHLIDGTIFVADTGNHRIQVFHPNGTFAFKIGGPDPGSGPGEFTAPVGIGLGKNREILVADTGNHRVQVFHPNGTFDFQFGSFGTADGEFSRPEGVMYDYQLREFVVADTGNHRIQTFHLNGTFAFKFGTYGTDAVPAAAPIVCTHPLDCLPPSAVGTVRFNEPTSALRTGIAPYPAAFSVADTGNNRIQSFSLDKLGGVDMPHHLARDQVTTVLNGTGGVEFDGIRSLATGAPLSVVADTGNHRVPRFGTYGVDRFDFSLGSYGSGPGEFSSPMGAAGSYRGYAVADTGNDRVQVFHRNTTLNFVLGLVGNATVDGGTPTDGGGGGGGTPTDGGGGSRDGRPAPPSLSHIALDLNGTLPSNQTGISGEAAAVTFVPRTNFTRAGTGEAYTGQLNVTVASDERREAAVAALAGLGNAGAAGRIGTVVEIGSPDADIALDSIAIIWLRNQPPHAELYHMDSAGRITEIPACGSAADPAGWLGSRPGLPPFCYVASSDDAGASHYAIYTYRLSAFFAVGAPPSSTTDRCSIGLADESFALRAEPGRASQPVKQTITNTGSLILESVEISATRWFLNPAGEPPYGEDAASLPPTLTELIVTTTAPDTFRALPADGVAPLPLAAGLPPDGESSLWLRINLDGRAEPSGGMLVQHITYVVECATPPVGAP